MLTSATVAALFWPFLLRFEAAANLVPFFIGLSLHQCR
jgi:hypothetical protein